MKTILHIIGESGFDGITIFTIRLIKNLPNYNHKIISLVEGSASNKILSEKIQLINIFDYKKSKFYDVIKYIKFIYRLKRIKYDIIHYHSAGAGILLLSTILSKKKIIHHIHSGSISGNNSSYNLTLIQKYIFLILANINYNVFVANHILERYRKTISSNPAHFSLILNSVPFNFNFKEAKNNSVGYLGRINEDKGTALLLEIIEEINQSDNKFIIKGEIDEKFRDAFSLAIHEKKILFEKSSFAIEKFLKQLDLLLFPSKATEGLPLVVLEALSFDVGVIAIKTGWTLEIFGNDYPLLVEELTVSAIMEKVKYYYFEYKKSDLSKYHTRILSKYRYDNLLNKINNVYSEL